MPFIININEREPSLLYEAIARYAFNGGKSDPEGITDAGFFDGNFIASLTHEGMFAMYAILDKLIEKEVNTSKVEDYYGIRNSLEVGMEHDTSIELLIYLADLINDH
ncbi:MAG: hypothetical protein V4565_01720 [Bacteroidota bacterium]